MIDLHGCVNHVVQCRCTTCTAAPIAHQLSSVQIQSLVLVLSPAAEAEIAFLFSFPCDSAHTLCPSHLGLFSLHTMLLSLPIFHT